MKILKLKSQLKDLIGRENQKLKNQTLVTMMNKYLMIKIMITMSLKEEVEKEAIL
jgi:hypothetical protein